MLKSVSNSKFFFVALGVTIALCGIRAFAGPSQDFQNTNAQLERIAKSLDKIQRDGIDIRISQKYSSDVFNVKVAK